MHRVAEVTPEAEVGAHHRRLRGEDDRARGIEQRDAAQPRIARDIGLYDVADVLRLGAGAGMLEETDDGRLDQKGDRRAQDERAQKVAKQEEDHDRHDQSPHAERDLQVATAPLRIENP